MAKKPLRNMHESKNEIDSHLILILFSPQTYSDAGSPVIFLYSSTFPFLTNLYSLCSVDLLYSSLWLLLKNLL